MNHTTLLTGATGFIGRHLCSVLHDRGIPLVAATRTNSTRQSNSAQQVVTIGDINEKTAWTPCLKNIRTIVHLAARVHVMQEKTQDPLSAFRRVNVAGTLNLARQAVNNGVKRFIFLSSIKVNGEATQYNKPFHPSDIPTPIDPYGISKLEAETGLQEIARKTGLEVIILRPPLVYGKEAGGNFARLRKAASAGIPLPLASVQNMRSLIGVDNLCDCIRACIEHPNPPQAPLLVSDNQDISTPELIRLLAAASGKKAALLPVPVGLLFMVAKIFGRLQEIQRLTENLQIDCSETMQILNWKPPLTLEQGIKRSVT